MNKSEKKFLFRASFLIILVFPTCHLQGQIKALSLTLDQAVQVILENHPQIAPDSLKRKLICSLKTDWNNWIFSINKLNTLTEYQRSISDLGRIAELHYEAGEIDYYEFSTENKKLAEIITNLAVCENDIRKYQNAVRKNICLTGDFYPADSALLLYEIDKLSTVNMNPEYADGEERSDFVKALEHENRCIELDNLFISIHYFRSFALEYADNIIAMANIKLQSEDIDYFEYSDFMTKAFKIRFDYLQALRKYNIEAIQLEYYAY